MTDPHRPWRRARLNRLLPDSLRKLDARAKPDLKRAVPALFVELISFAVGQRLGGIDRRSPAHFGLFGKTAAVAGSNVTVIVLAITLLFVVSGVVATRSVAGELARVISARGSVEASNAIRLVCSIVGYAIVGLGVLVLLRVNLGSFLVGGAVTGVVIGIAAQQTLGNFFAGLVLLFARPYVPGQRVKICSGALGGPFEGTITGSGLMYTTIHTAEGVISLPNAGLLSAAIGPAPASETESATDQPTVSA